MRKQKIRCPEKFKNLELCLFTLVGQISTLVSHVIDLFELKFLNFEETEEFLRKFYTFY